MVVSADVCILFLVFHPSAYFVIFWAKVGVQQSKCLLICIKCLAVFVGVELRPVDYSSEINVQPLHSKSVEEQCLFVLRRGIPGSDVYLQNVPPFRPRNCRQTGALKKRRRRCGHVHSDWRIGDRNSIKIRKA